MTEEQALFIIGRASDVLKHEPNLLEVDAPITGMPWNSLVASHGDY